MISLQTELNDRQREAVLATEGPLIVLAGAGSGKTKMLTSRISYLIDQLKVPSYQILAVTFTNKAAAEMKARIERTLAQASSGFIALPEVGTFHSVCLRILRKEMRHTPFEKPFVIYDDSDQLSLIKTTMAQLDIDQKSFSPKGIQAAINRAKCDAKEPHELEPAPYDILQRQVKRVYEQYQKNLITNSAVDFGEILCLTYRLLRDHPEVKAYYQQRYRYIHVDEYQDTNRAQYLLLSQLAAAENDGHKNICVVGDEDQSIYKWRGADIRNIMDFENDYPGAQVVKLEQNYRSSKTILAVAGSIIRNNKSRKDKTLWTDNEPGAQVIRAQLADERAEAEMVVSEIKHLAEKDHRAFGDFAIFYRTNAQSRQFEDVLRREKIPYQVVGGLRFYDRKEIKDILSYFKAIQNPDDSISMRRIINTPARGIGKTTIEKLDEVRNQIQHSGGQGETGGAGYWSVIRHVASNFSLTTPTTAKKLGKFVSLLDRLIAEQPNLLLSELYHLILDETGYVRELRQEGTEESLSRIENLEELDTLIQEFEEDQLEGLSEEEIPQRKSALLSEFIEQSSLASDLDHLEGASSSVKLMTLHSSKGLEFPVVFLVGMEEGLFPSVRPWEESIDEDIEEERRLCYVGMTRAREVLYLLSAVIRRIWGQVSYQEPSRFFTEIPEEYLESRDFSLGSQASQYRTGSSRHFGFANRPAAGADSSPRLSLVNSVDGGTAPGSGYSGLQSTPPVGGAGGLSSTDPGWVGRQMTHPEYGAGTVVSCEGWGTDQKVVIRFRSQQEKKFLLRYVASYFAS